MNDMSLPAIERTLQKTRLWLDDVMAHLGTTDRARAFRALRAVFHALRDYLSTEEAADIGSELPMLLRGLFFEGWVPSRRAPGRKAGDFLGRVAEGYGDFPTNDLRKVCGAVFSTMETHISPGELDDVYECLPSAIREMIWTVMAGDDHTTRTAL